MGLVGHVLRIGGRRDSCRVLVGGDPKEIAHLKYRGVDGRIILK